MWQAVSGGAAAVYGASQLTCDWNRRSQGAQSRQPNLQCTTGTRDSAMPVVSTQSLELSRLLLLGYKVGHSVVVGMAWLPCRTFLWNWMFTKCGWVPSDCQ